MPKLSAFKGVSKIKAKIYVGPAFLDHAEKVEAKLNTSASSVKVCLSSIMWLLCSDCIAGLAACWAVTSVWLIGWLIDWLIAWLWCQWYMVTVVHVYNRWSKSELKCYVDGNLVSHTEMSWLVNTSDVSNKSLLFLTVKYHVRLNSWNIAYDMCNKACFECRGLQNILFDTLTLWYALVF